MTGELAPSDSEAEADYPHRLVRWVAFLVAALLGVGSWTSRQSDPGYASLMLACAVLLLLVAITLPRLTKVSVSPTGGPSLELDPRRGAERRASAKAADAAVTSDEVAKEIASTDPGPPTASAEDSDVIGSLNYVAGNVALQGIFDWCTTAGSALEGCDLRLYLYDADVDRLLPVIDPGTASREPTAWEVGKGATGAAYATGEYVIATGAAVSDDTYGLSQVQQARFRSLAAVAAAPVCNNAGTVIGVLTASTSNLAHQLATEDGWKEHTLAALLVSRVLVELLQWFDDE